jgi:hypothetical protein
MDRIMQHSKNSEEEYFLHNPKAVYIYFQILEIKSEKQWEDYFLNIIKICERYILN